MTDLQKRIEILERKIAREKKARLAAESQLEEYSRQIYESSLSFKHSVREAQKREAELDYLASVSNNASSELSVKELVVSVVELTCSFSKATCALHLVTSDGKRAEGSAEKIWMGQDQAWISESELVDQIVEHLPLDSADEYPDNWLVSPVDIKHQKSGLNINWLVHISFPLFSQRTGWLVFMSAAELLDEETLYVLDTAKGQLLSGIRRRVTDIRVLKRSVELHEAMGKLDQTQQQLIQSEKMASLGQLAAGVAHEINNPVGYIKSNMGTLKEYFNQLLDWKNTLQKEFDFTPNLAKETFDNACVEADLDYIQEDAEDLIQSTIDGVERVKDIVADLKTFSHSGEEEFEQVELVACLESALKIAWNSLKYDYQVEQDYPESLPVIEGNPGQLQQVFVNLMVNAGQAMEQGGTLSLSAKQKGKTVLVTISDEGCGMDKETLDKLFTPFFTTKPVGVGTGLGLSVSYAILETHKAEVKVESEVGKGTSFLLRFPLA